MLAFLIAELLTHSVSSSVSHCPNSPPGTPIPRAWLPSQSQTWDSHRGPSDGEPTGKTSSLSSNLFNLKSKVAKIAIFSHVGGGGGPVQSSKIPLYGALLPKVKIVRAEIMPFSRYDREYESDTRSFSSSDRTSHDAYLRSGSSCHCCQISGPPTWKSGSATTLHNWGCCHRCHVFGNFF